MSPVPDVPIEDVACQIAVAGVDGQGDSSLRPETKIAIENAAAETGDSDLRRVRCTEEDARDLLQFFDRAASTLQLRGAYDRSTACARAAERLRRVLDGPVLT